MDDVGVDDKQPGVRWNGLGGFGGGLRSRFDSGSLLPGVEYLENAAKIVLRHGEEPGRAYGGQHGKGSAEGVYGLFKPFGTGLPLTQRKKGTAEVVLRRGPIEGQAFAGTFLKGGAVGTRGAA